MSYIEPVESTGTKTLYSLLSNGGVLYCAVFSDRKTLKLSADPRLITGISKLNYNVHVISHVIIRFLLILQFFLMQYDGVYELKTIRKIFLVLVILKSYEHVNELQGAVSFWSQTNTNT